MGIRVVNWVVFFLFLLGLVLAYFGWGSFWLVLLLGVLYFLFLLIVSTNVRFNFFVRSVSSNSQVTSKKLAITFDDGPAENTLKILEILEKYQVKAGFFCIGKKIEEHPETFRKIISSGHLVGNHSYTHTLKMGALGVPKLVWEIEECNRVARETAGLNLRLFRPPFGVVSPRTRDAVLKTGMTPVGWSIRSFDTVISSEKIILKRVKKKLKPGSVILFHDNVLSPAILEQLLLFLRKHNYRVERPDKLLNINAYT